MTKPQSDEWRKESSLTTPEDRNPDKSYAKQLLQGMPPLDENEIKEAMGVLNNDAFTLKFRDVERTYADPALPLQTFGLISFVPAKGATPNDKGVYGFAKLRGNFSQEIEANQRAEYLIRNVDSYHQIYHTYVGRPFPLTVSSKYSAETAEIDIRKAITESVSADIKTKKIEEKNTIKEIQERQAKLLEETKRDDVDPEEEYTTLKVKLAQVKWTYVETVKKLDEMKAVIIKTRNEIVELDKVHPDFQNMYMKRYMEAREASGLTIEKDDTSFIRYMVEDVDLGF